MSINSTIGHEKPNGSFPHATRTELDDLLDEILGDQIFLNNFPSQRQDGNEKSPETAMRQQESNLTSNAQQCNASAAPRTTVTTGWESRGSDGRTGIEKTQANVLMSQQTGISMAHPSWIANGPENQTGAGARSRAPSLPVNSTGVDHRRRLQSVPCNDYYGQTQHGSDSQSYYDRSDRFVHGLCSKEPITWLDRQKAKLQTRNENRRLLDRSNQQKQLMEELKMAQMMCARKRREQTLHDDPGDPYADSSRADASQTLEHESGSSAQTNEHSQGLHSSHAYIDGVKTSGEMCKSEKSFYVSGIERPPFTTHQTKYVFSVSSSRAANVDRGSTSPDVQRSQKTSAKPGPPTPKRVSSRDALRHSMVMPDWDLEQWEQGSHTSSDAPERSAFSTTDKKTAAGIRIAEDRIHQAIHLSSAGYLDPSLGYLDPSVGYLAPSGIFDSSDATNTFRHGANVPSLNSAEMPLTADSGTLSASTSLADANGTCTNPDGTFDTFLNGSSTSGTSSLSINSTSQSAFEPVTSYGDTVTAAYNERNAPLTASTVPKPELEPDLLPVSASIVVTSRKRPPSSSTPMHQSFSDSALGQSGFSRRSQSLDANAPNDSLQNRRAVAEVYETNRTTHPPNSSSFPSSVPFPSAPAVSAPKSQPIVPRVSASALPSEHTPILKRNDNVHNNQAVNSSGSRQLTAIAEQPSGNDGTGTGTEVVSLQLIGSGMQNLEPDGDLPSVRPVTPKFPHPGMNVNSSKARQGPLDNRRHSVEEKTLPPAAGQKFNSGPRRATMATCSRRSATGDSGEERGSCSNELRPHSVEIVKEDDQKKQRMKHRRHTTVSDQELLRANGSDGVRRSRGQNSCPDTAPSSAYHQAERLLNADLTAQGFDRRGSSSPGEQPRRNSKLLSKDENGTLLSKTDRLDGMDDALFTGKSGSNADDKRRDSKIQKQKQKEFSLSVLDNAVAGLQASANSSVDESSSSNTVVQSPQSGETTPRFYARHDALSPRTSKHPPPKEAANSSVNNTDATVKTSHAPRFVRDSSKYWHKPDISRDEAISSLKDKPAGTFVIRNSNSFPGAFGLALKVAHLPPNVHSRGGDPKAELVRHFLIEPTSKGVKLKGCSSEPVFGSLAALVYQHSMTPLSLPCKLIIPDQSNLKTQNDTTKSADVTPSEVLSQGAACNVLYINSVDMESLTGNEALDKSVAATFGTMPTPLTTIVHFKVSSQGITLTDTNRKLFFRRHYPVDTVTFAGIDPELRCWTWTNEETKTTLKSKIFGFVARKPGSPMDNACHVFAELDADQPAQAIVEFIMKVMLGHG